MKKIVVHVVKQSWSYIATDVQCLFTLYIEEPINVVCQH